MTKLSKTNQPQRRHGDPPEPAPVRKAMCRCDLDDRDGTNHLRYTGRVERGPNGTTVGWFGCCHGRRWIRIVRRRRS